MSRVPLTRERHGTVRWQRTQNFAFAAQRSLIPLVARESRAAATAFPIGFIRQSGRFMLVALVGLEQNENLFVGENGRWRARYVPAELQSYPFAMAPAEDGRHVLCVNEDEVFLAGSPDAPTLFDENGEPSSSLAQMMDFFARLEQERRATAAACKTLEAHGLIEPWPIAVRSESRERRIEGLFRVNENALDALSDAAFLEIRRTGGIGICYGQLVSMPQLSLLGQLAAARVQQSAQLQLGQDLDLSWLNSDIVKLGSASG